MSARAWDDYKSNAAAPRSARVSTLHSCLGWLDALLARKVEQGKTSARLACRFRKKQGIEPVQRRRGSTGWSFHYSV